MNTFAWIPVRTIGEAAALASNTVADAMCVAPTDPGNAMSSVVKAGGIDLLDLMKEQMLSPATLVSLTAIPGLARIEEQGDGGLRMGAMATLADLAAHALVRRRWPALANAVGESASPQIRHVATLGGNLLQRPRCWYFRAAEFHCLRKGGGHCFALDGENAYHAIFDNRSCAIVHPSTAATVLVALGAMVELANGGAAVRRVLLEDFFVPPGRDLQRENDLQPHEIMTAIVLPALPPGVRMAHLKLSQKESFDWPLADVAVVLDVGTDGVCRRASIVLGAAAPVPHRAKAAQAVLAGQRITDATASDAARAALEGATPLTQNTYKLALFETLVRRTILQAMDLEKK
ncbi:MAG: FAD binding domain-containing protein [Rhodoferax sp.]|nr:FAD binding domain-containing protein [Rhodoferax sp.]